MEPPRRSTERTAAGNMVNPVQRVDSAFTTQNWQQFLERHYHILSLNLSPMDFFTWLRTKDVLTVSDQELVLNSQHTTVAQMGLLVDIVKRKGEMGFRAFMEIVEFSYPEIFSSITGQLPRTTPPEGYLPDHKKSPSASKPNRQRPQSIEILGIMGDLVQTLFSGLTCKKEELSKLKEYCDEMQENICREKADLYHQMKCSNEMIKVLENEKDELNSKLESFTKERQEMTTELENLRGIKDKYMEESSKLGKLKDELSVRVQTLEDELVMYKSTPVRSCQSNDERCSSLPEGSSTEEICSLHRKLSNARKRILVGSFERAQLEGCIRELKNKHSALQQHSALQSISLEEIMNERNMTIAQKRCMEAELVKERQLSSSVSKNLHCYMDKFIYMENQLKKLQEELEQLKSEKETSEDVPEPMCVNNQPLVVPSSPVEISVVVSSSPTTASSESNNSQKTLDTLDLSHVSLRTSPGPRRKNVELTISPLDSPIIISPDDAERSIASLSIPTSPHSPIAPPRSPRSPVGSRAGRNRLEPVSISSSTEIRLEPADFSTSQTSSTPTLASRPMLVLPPSTVVLETQESRSLQISEISRARPGAIKIKEPHYIGIITSI